MAVEPDGTLVLRAREGPPRRLGNLSGSLAAAGAALDRLRSALNGPGEELDPVEIQLPETQPWRHAAWLIDAIWSPQSPRREFRLRPLEGAWPAVDHVYCGRQALSVIDAGQDEMPVLLLQFLEPDLAPGSPVAAPFGLRVARTSVPMHEELHGLAFAEEGLAWSSGWTLRDSARRAVADATRGGRAIEAVLVLAARPLRGRLSFGQVVAALRGLRDVQAAPVLLEGMTLDRPSR